MATVSIGFLCLYPHLPFFFGFTRFRFQAIKPAMSVLAASATLGLLGSAAATILFYTLIKKAGGLFASLVTYAVPVVAIGWGLLYKEAIGLVQLCMFRNYLNAVFIWLIQNPQTPLKWTFMV